MLYLKQKRCETRIPKVEREMDKKGTGPLKLVSYSKLYLKVC